LGGAGSKGHEPDITQHYDIEAQKGNEMGNFLDRIKTELGSNIVDSEEVKKKQLAKEKQRQEAIIKQANAWLITIQSHILEFAKNTSKNANTIRGQTPVYGVNRYYSGYVPGLFNDVGNVTGDCLCFIKTKETYHFPFSKTYTMTDDFYEVWNQLSRNAREESIVIGDAVFAQYKVSFSSNTQSDLLHGYPREKIQPDTHKSLTTTSPFDYCIFIEIPFYVHLA